MANNDGYEGWDRVAAEMHKATAHLFTNTEKAERLGVSTGTLKKLLAGEPVVHPAAIRSITQALGWPPDGIDRVRAGKTPGTLRPPKSPLPLELSASGVDLDAVRKADPDAYAEIVAIAESAMRRANRTRGK